MVPRRSAFLFAFLLALTFTLILVSAVLLIRIGTAARNISRIEPGELCSWHLMMIGQRTDSPFWQEVYAGASEVAASRGAVIELVGPASDADRKTPDEYIQYAVATRANGILAYVDNTPQTREALALAGNKGIPVITLENDAVSTSRQSFVGVSSYELGKLLGGLVVEAAGASADALVLLDTRASQSAENLMLASIQEAVQPYPGIRIQPIALDDYGPSGYEEAIRRRIMNDAGLDVIVCLNVEDTMRVTQAVIEMNRSDRISVIAFRESADILDYLRKGIIHAVVVVDARQMGRKAAEAMLEYLETGHSNDYVITDMHVITRDATEAPRK